ncbi:hypothetical protein FJZ17_03590 [Candidatus Pacearchaeota archaeon]|nr:hypothetical protein [Candidatus Pacearchaeota archaeon]
MKIFYYTQTSKLLSLGGKTELRKINSILNQGNSILLRVEDRTMQHDFRLRKIPEQKKQDRGEIKIIKEYYILSVEVGRPGFHDFRPKQVLNEQEFRFRSLERAINMLETKQGIKKADWLIF